MVVISYLLRLFYNFNVINQIGSPSTKTKNVYINISNLLSVDTAGTKVKSLASQVEGGRGRP